MPSIIPISDSSGLKLDCYTFQYLLLLKLPARPVHLIISPVNQFRHRHQLITLLPKAQNHFGQRLCRILGSGMHEYDGASYD